MKSFADTAEAGARPITAVRAAIGRDHLGNEVAVLSGPTWFAIADGMGGHDDGDSASRVAVRVLATHPAPSSLDEVTSCVASVDAAVRSEVRRTGAYGTGTTLVAAVAVPGGVAVAHVGDSRCYRLARGVLTLLTRDHSRSLVRAGAGRSRPLGAGRRTAPTAQPSRHPRARDRGCSPTRHVVRPGTRRPSPAVFRRPDGRSPAPHDRERPDGVHDPQAAAVRLVELATERSGGDNVTALVVDHLGDGA